MPIASIDPTTGKTIRVYDELSDSQVNDKLRRAEETAGRYRQTSIAERSRKMLAAAEILEGHKKQFGETMTTEMGKPIKAAIAEAEKCAWVCRYYAENAERFLAVNPLMSTPYRYLADAAEQLGQRDTASAACKTLFMLDPPDPAGTHYLLAKLLHQTVDASAKRQFLQALEEAPRDREVPPGGGCADGPHSPLRRVGC